MLSPAALMHYCIILFILSAEKIEKINKLIYPRHFMFHIINFMSINFGGKLHLKQE